MSFVKHLSTEIASDSYPWRWTTPIVLCASLFISGFLAAINVPLSAYEVVQEVTYRPNDTLPPLPLSNFIPAILQHPASSFTPQILTVGNTLTPNNSVFSFTIVEAYNELNNSKPVSSFSYYNNPLSNGCNVSNMSAEVTISPPKLEGGPIDTTFNGVVLLLSVGITCHLPTLFEMTWTWMCDTALTGECFFLPPGKNPARDVFNCIASDLTIPFVGTNFSSWDHLAKLHVAVQPCCDCNTTSPGDLPTQAPCSLLPAHLMALQIIIYNSAGEEDQAMPNTTDIFGNLPDHMGDYFPNICLQGLTALFQNTSPVMFNHTISDVYLPPVSVLGPSMDAYCANESRSSTTNATLMSEWENAVRLFNDSDNLPVINYFRIVPHLKPLGAAITSVIVSTFAMLSTLWTVFSLVAGALAPLHEGKFHLHRFI
ncbi:hypothetical protein B0H14DRAFT_2761265 [Mycena olivaceomarginata]|nr:hypothetical protein B0H14DRAFT_2761265 [Mycena olivaceomarginata]